MKISKSEYDILKKCQRELEDKKNAQILGPKDEIEGMAFAMSNINTTILDEIEGDDFASAFSDDIDAPIKSSFALQEDIEKTTNMMKNIMTDPILSQKTPALEEGGGYYIMKNIQSLLNDIYLSNSILFEELNNLFNQESDFFSGSTDEYFVELFSKIEIQFKLLGDLISDYKELKFDISDGGLSSFEIKDKFDNLETGRKQLQNNYCRIILLIKQQDNDIIDREAGKFLNKDFCPDVIAEIEKLEEGKWFKGIRDTISDYVKKIKKGWKWISRLWSSIAGTKIAKLLGWLWQSKMTIYFIGVIVYNFSDSSIIANGDFTQIIIAVSTAMCKSITDPIVLGSVVRWFTKIILQTSTAGLLSSRMYEYSAIVMGNATRFVGPLIFSNWIKKILTFLLNTSCSAFDISSSLGYKGISFTYAAAQRLNDIMNNTESEGKPIIQGLEIWWTEIGADVKEGIASSLFSLFGEGYTKSIFGAFFNPVGTAKEAGKMATEYISTAGEQAVEYVWDATGYFKSIIVGGVEEKAIDIQQDVIGQSEVQKLFLQELLEGIWQSGSICIVGFYEKVTTWLSDQYSWPMTLISPCVDKFNAIYEMGYRYIQLFFFMISTYSDISKFESDPRDTIIKDLQVQVSKLIETSGYQKAQLKYSQISKELPKIESQLQSSEELPFIEIDEY